MGLKELEFKNDLDMLFQAILELENIDECYKFFEDIARNSYRIKGYISKNSSSKKSYTEMADNRC